MAFFHARRNLVSSLLRALSSSSSSASSIASGSRFAFAVPARQTPLLPPSLKFPIRFQTSVSEESPANDSSMDSSESVSVDSPSNDSSKDSSKSDKKEAILLEGCDLEHWLIIMDFPKTQKLSELEMVNTYVKTLAKVVGSEEEAKKKIYSVATTPYTGFGAQISEELSKKAKGLPDVLWVLPDSYIDIVNKDYGGDLFVDGKVIPRPKYRYPQNQSDNKQNGRHKETRLDERRMATMRHNNRQNKKNHGLTRENSYNSASNSGEM